MKPLVDAYGVAVRTGAISPQAEDESSFRERLGLPPMGDAVKQAWNADRGVRRPITIAPTPTNNPDAIAPANPTPSEDPNDEDQENEDV